MPMLDGELASDNRSTGAMAVFEQFEESRLALLYEENSMFSKIVGRDTVERRERGEHDAAR